MIDWQAILKPGERLLWVGRPEHGRRWLEIAHREGPWQISLFLGCIGFAIAARHFREDAEAVGIFSAMIAGFLVASFAVAALRSDVLRTLHYALTDRRAIICKLSRSWRGRPRTWIVSAPLGHYAPSLDRTRPYPTLRVGTALSEELIQPLWHGLSHPGQGLLMSRISMPLLFENIPDGEEVLAMMHDQIGHRLA